MVGSSESEEKKFVKVEELSYHKLSGLIKKISKIKETKYKRSKETKYGNINRGFTEEELKKFFKCCKNEKAYLAFFLMANLGLRVGEVVKIKTEDIDFIKKKIRISTEKAHTGDFLYLHSRVQKLLLYWVQIPDSAYFLG